MNWYHFLIIFLSFGLFSCQQERIVTALETEMSIAMQTVQFSSPTSSKTLVDCSASDQAFKNEVVFIAGFDKGNDTFYTQATSFFKKESLPVVTGLYSLSEIMDWLNQSNQFFTTIHIVSHSNAWRGMSLKITPQGDRITTQQLALAIQNNEIPLLKSSIFEGTHIVFHSCGLGANASLLQQLKTAFTNEVAPLITATPYFNVFGGKYAPHFLATPHYVFYPTGNSPGPLALAQQAKKNYPEVAINWRDAFTSREETSIGTPYSYRFNIPVTWDISFNNPAEIPLLENTADIIDFVLSQDEIALGLVAMNIPLEAYRWRAKVNGNTLSIQGKATALTVLVPVMDALDAGAYQKPSIENTSLFISL